MEDQDIREEKRARNMVWAAAERYGFEPLFLAFSPEGEADGYLNMITGLSYRWYDWQKLEAFFRMLGGRNEELYEGLLWIGLENALYRKEERSRSAIRELRREYALASVKRQNRQREYSRMDQIRNGHCREILGLDSGLNGEDAALLQEFSFTADMTTEQILARSREIFERYFSYRPVPVKKKKGIYFLQKVVGAFHPVGQISATYVRAKRYEDGNPDPAGAPGIAERTKHFLFQLSLEKHGEHAKIYVTACFGQSICGEWEQKEMEQKLCTGNHKNSHLLFTRGRLEKLTTEKNMLSAGEVREIMEFRKECRRQREKNREHYEKTRDLYRNSIRRLSERLRISLETEQDAFPSMSTHGTICPRKVWQALFLENPRVFVKKEETESAGFSVDILMDASSSRKNSQEFIAAQGYVLEKSLERCGIPVQLYSYCSIRGYTVLRIFRTYEEVSQDREIFQYTAAGNNRDGLALRGAGYLMEKSPKEKRLFLVLTDASPQDDQNLGEGAFYRSREYTDEAAVEDAASEVRALQRKGITVVGIVTGSERSAEAARMMFGRDFVKIQHINEFADTVGRVLQEKIRQLS
ncbi:MAG: hypothetical protein PUB88_12205 [Clostridium sp.]|nr:hypothetical protein [Clostridium sp.]